MEPVDPIRVNFLRSVVNTLGERLNGGPSAVAAVCGTSRQSVHNWCARGVVYHAKPAVLLYRACQEHGLDVTLDAIVGLGPVPKRLGKRSPAQRAAA